MINQEEATPIDPRRLDVTSMMELMIDALRSGKGRAYGSDLDPISFTRALCQHLSMEEQHRALVEISPVALDAAWELCVRGLLRPGVREWDAQATGDGGYSLTKFGRAWLAEPPHVDLIVHAPGRVANLLEGVRPRFGPGFFQRAMEAQRCYQAHAYLSTCVMCGAAAESIFLALAIAKDGDEARVLKMYSAASGRSKVESLLIGKATDRIKSQVKGLTELMKDWRDEAGHGRFSEISADEAATAFDLLLRFALFAYKEWDQIIGGA